MMNLLNINHQNHNQGQHDYLIMKIMMVMLVVMMMMMMFAGESSWKERWGGNSSFWRQEESSGLPHMQVWLFAPYAGGLVIVMIIMMITIMIIIICILLNSSFSSGSLATLKEWLRTSKHMCCNIEPANPFTLTLKILNSKKYLIDTLSLQYPFS